MAHDLGSRTRPSRVNRMVLRLLRLPLRRWVADRICRIDYVGHRSGLRHELPVEFVRDRERLIVSVAGASGKQWWRNFRGVGRSLVVSTGAESFDAYAVALGPDDVAYSAALFGYVQHRRSPVDDDHRFVVIRLLDRTTAPVD
jgi:hypothetical protein